MRIIFLYIIIVFTGVFFTKKVDGNQNTIQIPKKDARYKIVDLYRVPYSGDTLSFPVPEEGILYSNRLRIFCFYVKDSCLFAGIDLKKGNYIYKINLKKEKTVKRIYTENLLDFIVYNDTLIVLNVDKFKFYNLQLDSIGEQMFSPIYKLQNVINSNYFLLDHMFTKRFQPGSGTQYEFVYDLKMKEYLDIPNSGEQFFPVTNCKNCDSKLLRDEIYNLPGRAELGQSNSFIVYETANLKGSKSERQYRKINLYDKLDNEIYNLEGIDKYFIAKDGIRPLTAINDTQFVCVSVNEGAYHGVVFRVLTIKNPK